jgi:hypothetical protein
LSSTEALKRTEQRNALRKKHLEPYVGKRVEIVSDIPIGEYYGVLEALDADDNVATLSILKPNYRLSEPTTYEETGKTLRISFDDIKRIEELD